MPSFDRLSFGWPDGGELARELSLGFETGKVTVLVGSSGCGKSTLLRLLAGLLSPGQGSVERGEGAAGFVFQSPTLLPWRTVAANVALPEELGGAVAMSVDDALSLVGLTEHAHKLPGQLSGGQQMRVSLARALRGRPELLLLDEPLAALDALTRRRLQQEFAALQQEHRLTAVWVTHDLDEAVLLADRVVLLKGPPVAVEMELEVDLPRPRTLHDPALGALVRQLEERL